jgi:hypothetical protein
MQANDDFGLTESSRGLIYQYLLSMLLVIDVATVS